MQPAIIGNYRKHKRNKLSQKVVGHITSLIFQKKLRPGDRLPPERELSELLGVSRTVLREAITALEEKGVLEVRRGSGAYVRNLSPDTVSECFSLFLVSTAAGYLELMDLRSILDQEMAGRLAERAGKADIEKLKQHLKQMEEKVHSQDEFADADAAFHFEFYRATGNLVLLTIMRPIMSLLVDAMRATFEAPGSRESSLEGHKRLVARIEARDPEGARASMREIIERGERRLRERMEAAKVKCAENDWIHVDE